MAERVTMLAAYQDFALSDMQQGRFKEALEWTEKALALIEKLDQPLILANCLEFQSFLLGEIGRYGEAMEKAERALSICLELREVMLAADCDSILALHLQRSGRSDEAIKKLRASEARYLEAGELDRVAECLSTADMWAQGKDVGLKVTTASNALEETHGKADGN